MLIRLMEALKWCGLGILLGLLLTCDAEASEKYIYKGGDYKYTIKCSIGEVWDTFYTNEYKTNQLNQIVIQDAYLRRGISYLKAADTVRVPVDICFIFEFRN